jgi:hypothetical protein
MPLSEDLILIRLNIVDHMRSLRVESGYEDPNQTRNTKEDHKKIGEITSTFFADRGNPALLATYSKSLQAEKEKRIKTEVDAVSKLHPLKGAKLASEYILFAYVEGLESRLGQDTKIDWAKEQKALEGIRKQMEAVHIPFKSKVTEATTSTFSDRTKKNFNQVKEFIATQLSKENVPKPK